MDSVRLFQINVPNANDVFVPKEIHLPISCTNRTSLPLSLMINRYKDLLIHNMDEWERLCKMRSSILDDYED